MNHVKRAVILAAGKGVRLQPLTLETPKPLIAVNGVRMIDTSIRALHENGIGEIYIVVGYCKERFTGLVEEYEGLTLIENPDYEDSNNISSLYAAREYLENAIILDGDQIVYDASALAPDFERSGYNAVWTDGDTNEWLLTAENGVVTGCSRTGGCGGWQLYSVSRWTARDGRRLRRHLEEEYREKGNRSIFWDDVALFRHPKEYRLGIRPMERGAVIEVDSLSELAAIDESYRPLLHDQTNGGSAS